MSVRGRTIATAVAAAVVIGLAQPPIPAQAAVAPPNPCRAYAALTFDDGPRSPYTDEVIAVLGQRRVRATFFFVGNKAEANPASVRSAGRAGHQVFSHSYSHVNLGNDMDPPGLGYTETRREIARGHQAVEAALGAPLAKIWRSPRLRYRKSQVVQRASHDLGFVHAGGAPTKDQNPHVSDAEVLANIDQALARQPDGTRLILHDGVKNGHRTVRMLPQIIDRVHSRGTCTAQLGSNGRVVAQPHQPVAARPQATRTGVYLSWAPTGPRSASPTTYRVYRSTTTTRPKDNIRHTSSTSYLDPIKLRPGVTYYYWFEARNEAGTRVSLRYKITG
jgi:peptidoglycan-N-acetylglucosamine deacetylase